MRAKGHDIFFSSVGIPVAKPPQLLAVAHGAKTIDRNIRQIPGSDPVPLSSLSDAETAREPTRGELPQRLSHRHRLSACHSVPLGGNPNRDFWQLQIAEQSSG